MSNISQDRRKEPEELQGLGSGNTIVYVEHTSLNGFQWGLTQASLVPLATTIITTSNSAVTYEFVRIGTTTIYYKLPPTDPNGTALPTSNGPTVLVQPNSRASIAFATGSGGPYSTGYVKVSDDGFGDFVPDGGDDGEEDDEE